MFWLVFVLIVVLLAVGGGVDKSSTKIAILFRVLLVIVLSYVTSFGSAISTDHDAYLNDYSSTVGMNLAEINFFTLGRSIVGIGYEPGYTALSIVAHFFNLGFPGFLFFLLLFVNSVYVHFIYQHKYPVLSVFFFVLSNVYILETNLVRQSVAIAIVFISFYYISNRRFLPSLLIIISGLLFHISAIAIIPVAFLALFKGEEHRKLVFYITLAAWIFSFVVSIVGINLSSDLAFLGDNGNTDYYNRYYSNENDTGMEGSFDIVINCVAIFVLVFLRKRYGFYYLLFMMGVILSNIAMAIPNTGRFALYFTILAPLYYTTIFTELPKKIAPMGNVLFVLIILNSLRLLLFVHIFSDEAGLGSVMYPLSAFLAK